VVAIALPATAAAEDPQRVTQPNDTAARACQQGPCSDYVRTGGAASEPLSIQPIQGRTFETGEIAFFNLDPPAWAYDDPGLRGRRRLHRDERRHRRELASDRLPHRGRRL
jgi:hypothetical protein